MAYDEKLVARVDQLLKRKKGIGKLKMFGGVCYLLNGNMLGGVLDDRIIIRVDAEAYDELLSQKYVEPFDFTGKKLTGILFIDKKAFTNDDALMNWLEMGIDYAKTFPKKVSKRAKKIGAA